MNIKKWILGLLVGITALANAGSVTAATTNLGNMSSMSTGSKLDPHLYLSTTLAWIMTGVALKWIGEWSWEQIGQEGKNKLKNCAKAVFCALGSGAVLWAFGSYMCMPLRWFTRSFDAIPTPWPFSQ